MLGRNENDLKNEIKIVQTINKDINKNFGLEKCARICLTLRRLMSYIYGAPILDVSRSHTTTQHSR